MNHNRLRLTIALMLGLAALGWGQEWEWQNPLPGGNDLNDVTFTPGGVAWAVGVGGTILHFTPTTPIL